MEAGGSAWSARRRSAPFAAIAAVLALSIAAGCRTSSEPTLANTFESPEAVARAVVKALSERNLEGLRSLALTRDEFRVLVWPKLPASRPERNLPMDYVWDELAAKSDASLRARLAGWQDRGFSLVSVEFKGEITDHGTYIVHRDTVLTLKDRDGRQEAGRLFGSIIQQRGRYKVFSYVVD